MHHIIRNALIGGGSGGGGGPSFYPTSLFSSGEKGLFYDFSDMASLFQDNAGTTPVTATGQTIGLIVDKSKGLVLGEELVPNAADREFSSDTGFWSKEGSSTISGGVVNINNPSGSSAIYKFNFPLEVGGYYEIAFDLVLTSGAVEVLLGGPSPAISTSGRKVLRLFRPSVGTFSIRASGGTAVGTIDNLTIKRVQGNHASQATAAARPLAALTGVSKWTNYDAVDDALVTQFQSSLGSTCTVARAVVGGAPVILTGQTIGTTFSDSTDSAGIVIINRALTLQETTDLTAWLTTKGATT